MTSEAATKSYFPALTGIRIIAAYMVFIHHNNYVRAHVFGETAYRFFNEMHVGVALFFVLSGFLIAQRYYDAKVAFGKYFLNRFARIYPIFFLLTTFTFLVYWLQGKNTSEDIKVYLYNISFLKGYFDDIKYSLIPPSWSLTVEETFYLFAPLFFILIRFRSFFLILLPMFFLAIGYALVDLAANIDNHGFMASKNFMFFLTFFGRSTEFFIGIGLALFFKKYGQVIQTRYITFLGFILVFANVYIMSGFVSEKYEFGVLSPYGAILNNFILPMGVVVFYWGLLTEKTWLSKLLGSAVFDLLGKSSYTFYLIHNSLIATFLFSVATDFWQFILLNVISILLFKLYEEPLNKLIRSFGEKQNKVESLT